LPSVTNKRRTASGGRESDLEGAKLVLSRSGKKMETLNI
jgi:hypothetical protein